MEDHLKSTEHLQEHRQDHIREYIIHRFDEKESKIISSSFRETSVHKKGKKGLFQSY